MARQSGLDATESAWLVERLMVVILSLPSVPRYTIAVEHALCKVSL